MADARTIRLLVVEDNPVNQRVAQSMLAIWDIAPILPATDAKALKCFA